MTEYEQLVATVTALDLPQEQKDSILNRAKNMNIENGVRGQDLINVKKDLETSSANGVKYKDLVSLLSKQNIKEDEISKIASKMGIEKTHEDEIGQFKTLLAEQIEIAKNSSAELNVFKQDAKYAPAFEQAVKDYVDKDGNKVDIFPDYVKAAKEQFLKGITEGQDEILVQNSMNTVLSDAHANQNTFLVDNGLVQKNSNVHNVPEGSLGGSNLNQTGITDIASKMQKTMVDGGQNTTSAMHALSMIRQLNEQ